MRLASAPGAIAILGAQTPSFSRQRAFARIASLAVRTLDIGLAFNRNESGRATRAPRGRALYFCASTASAMALAASSGVIFGLFTNDVMVSRIAPRYFCRRVMLWAKERTSVPSLIDACKAFCDCCWQGLKS